MKKVFQILSTKTEVQKEAMRLRGTFLSLCYEILIVVLSLFFSAVTSAFPQRV